MIVNLTHCSEAAWINHELPPFSVFSNSWKVFTVGTFYRSQFFGQFCICIYQDMTLEGVVLYWGVKHTLGIVSAVWQKFAFSLQQGYPLEVTSLTTDVLVLRSGQRITANKAQ